MRQRRLNKRNVRGVIEVCKKYIKDNPPVISHKLQNGSGRTKFAYAVVSNKEEYRSIEEELLRSGIPWAGGEESIPDKAAEGVTQWAVVLPTALQLEIRTLDQGLVLAYWPNNNTQNITMTEEHLIEMIQDSGAQVIGDMTDRIFNPRLNNFEQ